MFRFVGENCNSEKYMENKELETIFFPEENEKFIKTDFEFLCNKIKIYKNLGIGFYLDDLELKFIKAVNVLVKFNDNFNCFEIRYNDLVYDEIQDKDFDFNNKNFYIRYSSESIPKEEYHYKQLKKGDVVYPSNILAPLKEVTKKNTVLGCLFNLCGHFIVNDKIKDKDIVLEKVLELGKAMEYVVEEVIDDNLYIIKENFSHKEDLFEVDKIITRSYSNISNLGTKKNIEKIIDMFLSKNN